MAALILLLLNLVASPFKFKSRLEAENAALRQQLTVLQRKVRGRVRFTKNDRLFFIQLYRSFPSVLQAIKIIRPETLVRWHRAGFCRYGRWKSRDLGGRPQISGNLRALIRRMSVENILWGAPRIHGELLKLGFAVAQSIRQILGQEERPSTRLPPNGSELVLFDVNRTVKFGPLLRPAAETALTRILPGGPRPYRTTIVANADDHSNDTIERTTEAGATDEQTRALGLSYPPDMCSLSHLAPPFPIDDPLYGLKPDRTEHYGIELGALAPCGERNVLIASLDALLRASSNPFLNFMIERIEQGIDGRSASAAGGPPVGQHQ